MSAWCGNCHGDFHNNNSQLVHPSGSTLGGTIATTYGLYNGTESITGGDPATSYIPEVAFEDPAMMTFSTAGPSARPGFPASPATGLTPRRLPMPVAGTSA